MNAARFVQSDIARVSLTDLDDLKQEAHQSPSNRFRLCLHRNTEEKVHEMINVFCQGTYIQPHRHPKTKSESYHIISGALNVYLFDDNGKVYEKIEMGEIGSGKSFILRMSNSPWHMPVPFSDIVIFDETFSGPFESKRDVSYAPWAPDEVEKNKALEYQRKILSITI